MHGLWIGLKYRPSEVDVGFYVLGVATDGLGPCRIGINQNINAVNPLGAQATNRWRGEQHILIGRLQDCIGSEWCAPEWVLELSPEIQRVGKRLRRQQKKRIVAGFGLSVLIQMQGKPTPCGTKELTFSRVRIHPGSCPDLIVCRA